MEEWKTLIEGVLGMKIDKRDQCLKLVSLWWVVECRNASWSWMMCLQPINNETNCTTSAGFGFAFSTKQFLSPKSVSIMEENGERGNVSLTDIQMVNLLQSGLNAISYSFVFIALVCFITSCLMCSDIFHSRFSFRFEVHNTKRDGRIDFRECRVRLIYRVAWNARRSVKMSNGLGVERNVDRHLQTWLSFPLIANWIIAEKLLLTQSMSAITTFPNRDLIIGSLKIAQHSTFSMVQI